MKKTLKIRGCAHNPTYDSLQVWYKSSFQQLGWMIIANHYNYTDQINTYKKKPSQQSLERQVLLHQHQR
jgi:hypothetical protein